MNVSSVNHTAASYAAPAAQAQSAQAGEVSSRAKASDSGVVYESTTDRSAIVAQMKQDAQDRTSQLRSLVENMMKEQGTQIANADSMWRFLAKGNFTVTAEAKAQAQAAIAENGYWGVEQTSQRIVDFAKALAGDDPSKIEDMKKAFEKGFKSATKSWGQKLPDISHKTYDAVMKKFDEWSGKTEEE